LNHFQNANPTILALASVTRQYAQELIDFKWNSQLISIFLSCFAISTNEIAAWILVMIGLVSIIVSLRLGNRGQYYHNISRQAQRLALLEDSFGNLLDNFQVVELRRKINHAIDEKLKQIIPIESYYSSNAFKGNFRLKENIQQSTFWSKNLLEIYAKTILKNLIIVLIICILFIVITTYTGLVSKNLNPFLVAIGGILLIYGLFNYFNGWFDCKSSAELLSEVDQRLEKIDIENIEVLLANFADYGIATVTAPPIPYKIYIKNKKRLNDLWNQRIENNKLQGIKKLQNASILPHLKIELSDSIIPNWISKDNFYHLLSAATSELATRAGSPIITKLAVFKMDGYSGVPVFDIRLFNNESIFRHLILRLHKSAENAKYELTIVKRLSDEGVDLVSYIPLEEPYISYGALFYYHVNLQTHDQLVHINDYVISFFDNSSTDFEIYFNKMFSGFRNIAIVYEKITGNYLPQPFSSSYNEICKSIPPSYILDLRKMNFTFINNSIVILHKDNSPIETDIIISSPFDPLSESWFKDEFEILEINDFNNNFIDITIKLEKDYCKVLIPETRYSEIKSLLLKKMSIIFKPNLTLLQINKFYESECEISLVNFNPFESISRLHSIIPKQALLYGFRHRDLHCKNCLTSKSNFKIIDIGDSNKSMICTDIARLEISLLSFLINKYQLSMYEVETIVNQIENDEILDNTSEKPYLIANLIKSLRRCFYEQFKVIPNSFDIDLCYYIEVCQQLTYSISSPMKLSKGIEPVIHYWNNKINNYIL
jgi:hypothetical protein